ncbi:MAG: hypothetical protein WDZ29_08255 [Balneolaceae bacterium]
MEELNGVTIYWLISIGLLIGYFVDLLMGKRGMHLTGNLISGVVASLLIGIIGITFSVYGSLLFAAIGTVAFLLIVNLFSTHPEEKATVGISGSTP